MLVCINIKLHYIQLDFSSYCVGQLLSYVTNGTVQCAINWHEWVWG